ncbi:MAG: hypothetical protein L0Y79_06060 [Chlorobi bacterium]|nr:hypothetical protein [Chlorobiota bacterium]MCI0714955.1 hypothetical protein [Chlorobiota bacterium]
MSLFIEPVIRLLVKKNTEKFNVVLIDDSRSNSLNSKLGEVKRIMAENNLNSSDYKIFTFSNTLGGFSSIDSLASDGFETNLSNSFRSLRTYYPDEKFNSITVISDGIFNSGSNPLYEARAIQAPIITVGIGDTIQRRDVVVSSVLFNNKSFTNITTKIKAQINVYELSSGTVNVKLFKEGGAIFSKDIAINPSLNNYETEFDVTETSPGKVKYRIEAEKKEGEVTFKNNNYDFYIEYIDNKVNILFISGGPSADNAFITGILKKINNYNVILKTLKNSNEFYERLPDLRILPELSVVFLHNFPIVQYSANILQEITTGIRQHNIPIIFFSGRNTDYQKLQQFDDLIPFNVSRTNSAEVLFSLQAVSTSENTLSENQEFNSVSQIFKNVSGITPKAGAVTLMTDKSTGEPILITRNSGKNKSTAFLGFGLWRWRLNPTFDAEKTLQKFLIETINLTLQKEKKSKFKVYPEKDIFDHKESVKIISEVYDENFVPTKNAKVTGRILGADGQKIHELSFNAEDNVYITYINQLPLSEYQIEAEAELNGSYYGKDNSKFLVDSTNAEFSMTKSDFNGLRELSNNTSGIFIDGENSEIMALKISEIKNQNIQAETALIKNYNLWENKFVLILIIVLFTSEWILKKRNNIP